MDLASARIRLLEVAPWWSFARRFQTMPNIEYAGIDLEDRGPYVTEIGDVSHMPFESRTFDAVICVHVLEHVDDDRVAIEEMERVLRPGGWALVTVPINLDGPTIEDPAVTDPVERKRLFGEPSHVRLYGLDVRDRLERGGFKVDIDFASEIPEATRMRHGLRDDENIFMCAKAADTN